MILIVLFCTRVDEYQLILGPRPWGYCLNIIDWRVQHHNLKFQHFKMKRKTKEKQKNINNKRFFKTVTSINLFIHHDWFQVKKGKYKQNNCMLTALLKKSYADFSQLCNALLQTKQEHIISQFLTQETVASEFPPKLRTSISEGGIRRTVSDAMPVDDSWKLLIQSRMCLLMEKIDPDNGLIPQLVQKDLIPVWIADTFSVCSTCIGDPPYLFVSNP